MLLRTLICRQFGVIAGATAVIALGLNPAGAIEITVPSGSNLPGALELELMAVAFRLMLFVVIPVLLLTVFFAWRFRAISPTWPYQFPVRNRLRDVRLRGCLWSISDREIPP